MKTAITKKPARRTKRPKLSLAQRVVVDAYRKAFRPVKRK